jgi:phenylalanyl-tRNA synthetase alpha chain
MKEDLERIRTEALTSLETFDSEAEVEQLRIRLLGRKGELTLLVRRLREVEPNERPTVGAQLNQIKDELEQRIAHALEVLRTAERERRVAAENVDVTQPGNYRVPGRLHPLTQTMEAIVDAFVGMGFEVADGPDIEDEYHNFTALNIPRDHPARDMQDTFFVTGEHVLRTHTSPVQIRVMESRRPPLRIVVPGAAYRIDNDNTHSPMFHQIEGFMVDRHVTFGDLKGVLAEAMQRLFGRDTRVRFRASYFPFTEPSAEVDIGCVLCAGRDAQCRICKGSGWLEVLGAGLIDPNVFNAVGYDPEQVSGFAFGMGLERITMLRYQINDIRLFYANDIRFLRQF